MISKSISLPFYSLIFVKTIFWKIIVFKIFYLFLHPIKVLIILKKKAYKLIKTTLFAILFKVIKVNHSESR